MRAKRQGTKKKDGRWQIVLQLTDENGAKFRKTFTKNTQREVQAAANEFLLKNQDRRPRPTMKVSAYLDLWIERKSVAEKTLTQYKREVERAKAAFGNIQLDKLTPYHIEGVCLDLVAVGKGRTAALFRVVMRAALNYALKQEWVHRNSAALASPPKYREKERLTITWPMLNKIIDNTAGFVPAALWRFLAETGLRPDREALSLTWTSVKKEDDGWWLAISSSKTEAGIREIPLTENMVAVLKSIQKDDCLLLFPSENNSRLLYRNVCRSWYGALKQAKYERTNLYQLRHLCGTTHYDKGTNEHITAALMGHTSPLTTRRYYVRAHRDRLREAVES